MATMIPCGKQNIDQEDIDSVIKVLKSDFITQGPAVKQFENLVSSHCDAKYSFATNSATSALHISCQALGVKQGDIVWTSPISFVASANCALYLGAKIDFVDIDKKTYNMCVSKLEEKLIKSKKIGKLPKVVIPVHMTGQSCDMQKIHELSQKFGFRIIEDASHAIGGKYQNKPIGSCVFSDICIFSFHPVKIITTGEGGIAITNNKNLAEKINILRTHGITREKNLMEGDSHGDWYYQQVDLGYNYRMTDIQAALGISQIRKLDDFVTRRHKIAEKYNQSLQEASLMIPYQSPDTYSSYHLYIIRLKLDKIKKSRKQVFDELRKYGIGVNVHYVPIHTQPYYQKLGFSVGDFPEAEKYYEEAISIPIFQDLTENQQDYIIETVNNING
jgi:UDP-4-amino-4,6-dideoxy-N-acetyl-beta-L-altrosamine transaminase